MFCQLDLRRRCNPLERLDESENREATDGVVNGSLAQFDSEVCRNRQSLQA